MSYKLAVLVFVLTGCGGSPFTSSLFENSPDAGGQIGSGGDPVRPDTGTGGASGTGGSVSETGGRVGLESGGRVGSGGALGSGGSTGGVPSTGGEAGGSGGVTLVDACVLVTHDNGLGQTWQDCVPLGTYDEAQAMKACKAAGATSCVVASGCADFVVHGALVGNWGYDGPVAGYFSVGGLCAGPTGNIRWQ